MTPHQPTDNDSKHMTILLAVLFAFILLIIVVVTIKVCLNRQISKEKEKHVIQESPVVVTSATHTAPGGYPVVQMPPQPTAYQTATVYAAPYPTHTYATNNQMQMPMPMPVGQPMPGGQAYMAPYPPAPVTNMNPPSYDMAMGAGVAAGPSPSGGPVNASSGYEKQQPYNPSFTAH